MMERVWNSTKDDRRRPRAAPDQFEAFVLPSRASALASVCAALEEQEGPALVTGEAGVGKTWLWRRLRADRPTSWDWVDVELAPTDAPAEFYRAIGHALGLIGEGVAPPTRLDLADHLAEAHVEGRRLVLVVDEAQNLSTDVLEELRLQSNRLGRPGGFAGLVLVGQTPLTRRLATRSLAALEARISARAHLRALDVEEARALLDRLEPGRFGDDEGLERLHRDAGGSPRRLILLSARQAAPFCPPSLSVTSAGPGAATAATRPNPTPTPLQPDAGPGAPLLGSSRPPLRLEEGLIEVGWDAERGSTESAPTPEIARPMRPGEEGSEDHSGFGREAEAGSEAEVDEVIDDPYTAIQARSDQGRRPEPAIAGPDPTTDLADPEETGTASRPNVWAEGQHEFAPYSHLFSRLRQPRESP